MVISHLFFYPSALNGTVTMIIISYFKCLEPETRHMKNMGLPALQPIAHEEQFQELLQTLPNWLRLKLNAEWKRYTNVITINVPLID